MSLAAPLGFLGLLGLGVLILIYLLKPNYQQKMVSSTFVWKLSLKYRKKKVPISKLRNILILICQILIILMCSFIMAKPVIAVEVDTAKEKVLIIDASASMLTEYNGETRYERAVKKAKEEVTEILSDSDGVVSVLVASDDVTIVFQRVTAETANDVSTLMDALLEVDINGRFVYTTYGEGKVAEALPSP